MPHHKSKHECTIHGLHEWFEAKFEKLGWMAIAKEHGHDITVSSYLQSISHLKDCLKDKIESVHDVDRKDDLKIMLKHIEILIIAAHKLLDSSLISSSKHKKHYNDEKNDATFYGLHKWETALFEKLGWMVLAKNEGNNIKIKAYMYSIYYLKSMLMKKMGEVQEKDRKDDLKILYDQAFILWRAAARLLGKPEGASSMHGMSGMHGIVHSNEAKHGMVMKMDKKGKKHLSLQSSKSAMNHNKPRHTRKDMSSTKSNKSKKNKKTKKSNTNGSIFGGLF